MYLGAVIYVKLCFCYQLMIANNYVSKNSHVFQNRLIA